MRQDGHQLTSTFTPCRFPCLWLPGISRYFSSLRASVFTLASVWNVLPGRVCLAGCLPHLLVPKHHLSPRAFPQPISWPLSFQCRTQPISWPLSYFSVAQCSVGSHCTLHTRCLVPVCRVKCHRGRGFSSFVPCRTL